MSYKEIVKNHPNLNVDNVRIWVDELKSGLWPQTKNVLHNSQGLCCLGVACAIAPKGTTTKRTGGNELNVTVAYSEDEYVLPAEVQKWLGLNGSNPPVKIYTDVFGVVGKSRQYRSLSHLNDEMGLSLPEIGEIIERNFL